MTKLSSIFFPLLLLLSCHSVTTYHYRKILVDSSPAFLKTGLPDESELQASNTAAKKYGFHYEWAGGCVPPKHLQDSIKHVNDLVNKSIAKVHGKDWCDRFYDEVEMYRELYFKIESLAGESRVVSKINKELFMDDHFYFYQIDSFDSNSVYVNVCSRIEIDGKYQTALYYTIQFYSAVSKIIDVE